MEKENNLGKKGQGAKFEIIAFFIVEGLCNYCDFSSGRRCNLFYR